MRNHSGVNGMNGSASSLSAPSFPAFSGPTSPSAKRMRTRLMMLKARLPGLICIMLLLGVLSLTLQWMLWSRAPLAGEPGLEEVSSPPSYAFATLLCDDVMLDSVLVLGASIRHVNSTFPFIVLTLANLSSDARRQLQHPRSGVTRLHDIEQLTYPFQVSKAALIMNKPCRYSKLHLWNMTEYSKIVFLDADVMLLRNVDELFEQPELSAVPDLAGVVNTGVIVAEPNAATFSEMVQLYFRAPSYNHGDQGFINWYFGEHLNGKLNTLPAEYNVVSRYQEYSIWDNLKANAKIMHFTSETKPWTFYYTPHPHWQRNMDGQLFYIWLRHSLDVLRLVKNRSATDLAPFHLSALNYSLPGRAHIDHLAATAPICAATWRIKLRTDKYSVVIGTFGSEERLELLARLIAHYRNSSFIDRIFLTWHNPNLAAPAHLKRLFSPADKRLAQVVLLPQRTDSLNNRFNPIVGLRTRCVYIADDDVRIPITDIDYGFKTWQQNTQRLVGYFPRSHIPLDGSGRRWEYALHTFGRAPGYSILLTKGYFSDALYLYAYTCLLPPHFHAYVNLLNNCEDILFNMMVSGMTGLPPLALHTLVDEFGAFSGISFKGGHLGIRNQCLDDFTTLFGGQMPLRYSETMLHPYPHKNGVPYRKRNLTQW